jgi:hypothetical protein
MAQKPVPVEIMKAIIEAYAASGGIAEQAARQMGISVSTFKSRISQAKRRGMFSANTKHQTQIEFTPPIEHPARLNLAVENGVVIIGSDAHYWPGKISTAHKAFVKLCKELKPKIVIMNGDVFDGAKASRHPSIGWEKAPTISEELEACKDRLGEIERACGKAMKIWTLGNHCLRFETRLANTSPEYANINGVHLKDHFPNWKNCWSVWINNDLVVKHRFKGGLHATHNNTVTAGKSMATGHLHSLKVTPYSDYNGTRFGIDTGTLAQSLPKEPQDDQFVDYIEDNPVNWRSGFVVVTFSNGKMLWPEVVHVIDRKRFEFRGRVYTV